MSKTASNESQKEAGSKKGLFIGLIALVVVIAVAAAAYGALAPTIDQQQVQEQTSASATADDAATAAPDFTMESADGSQVSLSSFRGKPVVLNFWASTCGPCKMEMPEFQSAYERYGDRVSFVMVNIPGFNGETRKGALQLIDQSGYTFPIYFDSENEAAIQYGLTSIPRTYFISANGTLEAQASGAIDGDLLDQGIAMIVD